MKENKVNVDLIVPSLGERYNLFIPVNKSVGEVIQIINNCLNDISGYFPENNKLSLLYVVKNKFYDYELLIIDTDIENGSVLALL